MGGRWFVTTVQVSYILKGEHDEGDLKEFILYLKDRARANPDHLDTLVDKITIKDLEV